MSTAKASLRSFQDEIDQIQYKETAKQRAQAQVTVDREVTKKPLKDTPSEPQVEKQTIDVVPTEAIEFDDAELQVGLILDCSLILLPMLNLYQGMVQIEY